jgi:DNA invertase Pin-like site-specific DNA recombinase
MLHGFPVSRVYSYTRFSTPEQAAGDGYRRQTEAARDWAEENGLKLDESLSITDLGVSAFKGGNLDPEAGLGRFIDAVKEGLVEPGSVLLVESLDRLSRMEPLEAQHLFSTLILAGIAIVTLSDGQRYDRDRLAREPWAMFVALSVAMRAHEESALKGRRVAAAWEEKRRKVRAGEAKRLTKKGPLWLRPDGDWWTIDEAKAAIVRRVYRMALDGMGENKIAQTLNREGVSVLGRGKQWHRSAVSRLLRNRAVIGELVPGRVAHKDGRKVRELEEPIPGAFPPIIEAADWAALRSLKDGHAPAARGRGAGRPLQNLLGGLARCPICGSAMTRVNKGNRKKGGNPKLVCTRAKGGKGCQYHSVPLREVEEAVLDKAAAWLVEGIPAGDKGGKLDRKADELRGQVDGLEIHLTDLIEAVEATGPSRKAAERIAKLGAEIDTAQAQLEAVEEQRRCVDGGLIHARTQSLVEAIEEFDGTAKEPINATLKVLFDGVTVDYRSGQLVFHWRQGGETAIRYEYGFEDEGPEGALDAA